VLAVEADTVVLGGEGADAAIQGQSVVSLVFRSLGGIVALSGTIGSGPLPGTARFTVADSAHVPQPRSASRLALELDATVTVEDGTSPAAIVARVIDVAAGGLGVRGFTAPVGTTVTVAVALPDEGRVLSMPARVVRTRPDGCGLAFAPGADEVASAMERFVIACRAALLARRRAS